jgi:two-component system OmpR family sensor kinase
MRAIEDEAARMEQLVEDLLLLARIGEERPLATRPIALDRVVELAVSAAKVVDPARPLDCQLEQPIVVAGDETRLRQVVNNLLANTRRHRTASVLW